MFRCVLRQRRRILFGIYFLFLGMVIYGSNNPDELEMFREGRLWEPIVASILTALIVTTGVAMYVTIFHKWRTIVEILSLFLFVDILLSTVLPNFYGYCGEYWFSGFLPFAVFMLIFSVTYGSILDRFPMWIDYKSTRSFKSPKTAEDLWHELLPGKSPANEHYDTLLHDIEEDPDEEDSYDVRYTHGSGFYEHKNITYLEQRPFSYAKFYYAHDVDPKTSNLVDGTFEIEIEPLKKGGCKVTLTDTRKSILPRLGLQMWFDDTLGSITDMIYAKHKGKRDWSTEGRYRRSVKKLA